MKNDQDDESTPKGGATTISIGFHPFAGFLPMMNPPRFNELCSDVKVHGLLAPIWLHEGEIVDGRNRYLACLKVGVEPRFQEWDQKGTLIDFVLSLNLKRRHLTSTQKTMVAFRMLPMLEAGAKERQIRKPAGTVPESLPEQKADARDQAAAMVGVCGRYVSDIKRIAQDAPEKLKALESGALTLQGAKRQIAREKNPQGESAPVQLGTVAMQLAASAISQLSKIKVDDPLSLAAMERVQAYIDNRIRQALSKTEKKLLKDLTKEEQLFLFKEHELGR